MDSLGSGQAGRVYEGVTAKEALKRSSELTHGIRWRILLVLGACYLPVWYVNLVMSSRDLEVGTAVWWLGAIVLVWIWEIVLLNTVVFCFYCYVRDNRQGPTEALDPLPNAT